MNLLRSHEEMRHFEQLAGYKSVQSQHDVEVDGDATQPDTEHQGEPQQPNSQPIGHTIEPQSTRTPLHPNRDGTCRNKGKQKQTSWVWNFFTTVSVSNVPRQFKTVCEVWKRTPNGELEQWHDDSGISLNQAQIFGFPGANPAQFTTTGISPGLTRCTYEKANSCFTNSYTELLN
ncbi:hypothetical protein Cgig2_014247 [Carnegiea gigantea]|uniref:Uncharacterized protein n=1 Tax=Carnegiea gigantea TaxID=171969 RepID=A0A9Q1K3A0_9CARY|nr:hypothetical protein Cgig2_014247 [Carnegiea gigantea]